MYSVVHGVLSLNTIRLGKRNVFNITKKKTSVIVIIALVILYIVPLCAARIGNPLPPVPGQPSTAQQIDLTSITPQQNVQQITSDQTQILAYRNVTLVLNCTRNLDLNITVDEQVNPRILAFSLEPAQDAALSIDVSASPPLAASALPQTLNFYVDLKTDSSMQLQAQMKLNINATSFGSELNREINPAKLTWMYWNTTLNQWVQVPSYIDEYGYLVCSTTHFSTWTVSEVEASPTPTVAPSTAPSPTLAPAPTATPALTPSPTATAPTFSASLEPSAQPTTTPNQTPQPTLTPSTSATQSTSPKPEPGTSAASPVENPYIMLVAVLVVAIVGTDASVVVLKSRPKK